MTLAQDFFAPIAEHLKEHVHRLESLFEHASAGNEG
jgi:hypothetical protein